MRHCKSHYPQHARQLAERDYHSECCVEPVGTEFITGDSIGFVGENPAERAKETKLFWKFFDCNVYSSFNRENPHVICSAMTIPKRKYKTAFWRLVTKTC